MRTADSSPTSELWSTTHAALLAGRWSIARRLLDDLARRSDYVDHLCSLATYVDALKRNDQMKPLESSFRALLADRIELVNARAERNRDERLQQGRRELGNASAFDSASHAIAQVMHEASVADPFAVYEAACVAFNDACEALEDATAPGSNVSQDDLDALMSAVEAADEHRAEAEAARDQATSKR